MARVEHHFVRRLGELDDVRAARHERVRANGRPRAELHTMEQVVPPRQIGKRRLGGIDLERARDPGLRALEVGLEDQATVEAHLLDAEPRVLHHEVGVVPDLNFNMVIEESEILAAREEAISFAAFRIMRARFAKSPGAATTLAAAIRHDSAITASPRPTSGRAPAK